MVAGSIGSLGTCKACWITGPVGKALLGEPQAGLLPAAQNRIYLQALISLILVILARILPRWLWCEQDGS